MKLLKSIIVLLITIFSFIFAAFSQETPVRTNLNNANAGPVTSPENQLMAAATGQYRTAVSTGMTEFNGYELLMSSKTLNSVPEDFLSFKFQEKEALIKGENMEGPYWLQDKFILPGSAVFLDVKTGDEVKVDCDINYASGQLSFKKPLESSVSYKIKYLIFPFRAFSEFVVIDTQCVTEASRQYIPEAGKYISFRLLKNDKTLSGNNTTGPYMLDDKMLVPGDEVVWLRKRIKKAGEEYYLDYYLGRLDFREPVSDTSTIKVTYRYLPFGIILKDKNQFFIDISMENLIKETVAEKEELYNLYDKEDIIPVKDNKGAYYTVNKQLIPESERIIAANKLLARDMDYTIDYRTGEIYFKELMFGTTGFRISYKCFPFSIQDSYGRKKEVEGNGLKGYETDMFSMVKPLSTSSSKITLGGAKTFEVKFQEGDSAPTINQSLRIDASGNVTDDIKIKLLLSDQNMPLQQEGNTEVIEDLDKAYIEVAAKDSVLTMGDYSVSITGREFIDYQKKLQGIKGDAKLKQGDFTIYTANTGGEFASVPLTVKASSVGPYKILVDGKQVTIKAGTEVVWYDDGTGAGYKKLTRGSNNDYEIEYGDGTIEFTIDKIPTDKTKVLIDLEYTKEDYLRRITFGMTGNSKELLSGKLKMGFALVQEYDDEYSNPKLYDTVNNQITEYWTFLSENTLFDISKDTAAPLPPIKHTVLSMNGNMRLGQSNLNGEVAYTSKNLNKIYAGNEEDPIVKGLAGKFDYNSSLKDIKLGKISLGNADITGSLRSQGSQFRSLGKDVSVDFADKWNLKATDVPPDMTNFDGEIKYQPFKFLTLSPHLGVMSEVFKSVEDTGSYKASINSIEGIRIDRLIIEKLPLIPVSANISGYWDRQDRKTEYSSTNMFSQNTDSLRDKWQLSGDFKYWKLQPSFSYYYTEEYTVRYTTMADASTGAVIAIATGTIAGSTMNDVFTWGISTTSDIKWFSISFNRNLRGNKLLNNQSSISTWKNALSKNSEEITNNIALKYFPEKSGDLKAEVNYNDSVNTTYSLLDSSATQKNVFIKLNTEYNPRLLKRALRTSLRYDMANNFSVQVPTRTETTINAGITVNINPKYLIIKNGNWFINRLLLNWTFDDNLYLTEKTGELNNTNLIMLKGRMHTEFNLSKWRLSKNNFMAAANRNSDVLSHNQNFCLFPNNNLMNFRVEFMNHESYSLNGAEANNSLKNTAKMTAQSNVVKGLSLKYEYDIEKSTSTGWNRTSLLATEKSRTCENAEDNKFSANWQFSKSILLYFDGTSGIKKGSNITRRKINGNVLRGTFSISSKGSVSASWIYDNDYQKSWVIRVSGNYAVNSNLTGSASLDLKKAIDQSGELNWKLSSFTTGIQMYF